MLTKYYRSIALLLMAPLLAVAATSPGIGNLGDSLLDAELAKALSPTTPKNAKAGADWLPTGRQLDELLQRGAMEAAGEDVGGSPLASVVADMRRAERLIHDKADDRVAAPVQREVVAKLDQLIAQMEKQCQGGSCNKSGSKDNKRQASKRSQPKQGPPKEGQCDKPGSQASKMAQQGNKSGTTSLSGAPTANVGDTQQEVLKSAWGHLPERMREQMIQGSGNDFLPEYRDELQQYYRRLAERSSKEAP